MTDSKTYLFGEHDPVETLDWFRATFLPALIGQFNRPRVRRHLGLYANERIPENERNLTDVRNRVSLIIEYQLANQLLEAEGIEDTFWAYVVSNRFPDLEIRNTNGGRGLRFEVKCLQSIAEEKAANFDTLKKDLNPLTDFIVVFIWEWDPAWEEGIEWDQAPRLLHCHVFHASTLAELRDYYWLNRPPPRLKGGYQGFDLRYAVNCRDGIYNEEEGNYGKLLRLWTEETIYHLPATPIIDRTISDYLNFSRTVIVSGFETVVKVFLPKIAGVDAISALANALGLPAYQCGDVAFVLCPGRSDRIGPEILRSASLRRVFVFGEKYSWTEYRRSDSGLRENSSGNKPKQLLFYSG